MRCTRYVKGYGKQEKWPEDWGHSTFIPIPKKGDLAKCTNYRTISLMSHASKVLLKVILSRTQQKTEPELPDEQAGFRLSPYLFNIVSETIMRKALEGFQGGISIGGRKISNLRYADDIVLLASSIEVLLELVSRISRLGKEYNLLINSSKTKAMALKGESVSILIDGEEIEQVHKFPYLGSVITDDATSEADFKHR